MDTQQVAHDVHFLLLHVGEDPRRPGLQDTPRRVAEWWAEFLEYEPGDLDSTFDGITTDQMVAVSGLRVWSLCEHHLLPFWVDITVGYLTRNAKVIGVSKLARVAHKHAHRLQIQERLVDGIAREVAGLVGHQDVAVLGEGEHLCMVMRGIRTPGLMHTNVLLGAFRDQPETRAELMDLVRRHR